MTRERVAALAGVLYVVLDVVVGVMAGSPPAPAAPQAEIVAYISDHRSGLAVGLWLFGLATLPLLWWLGSLWAHMSHAEEDSPRLAVVSMAGLILGGTMALTSAVVLAVLALLPTDPDGIVALYTLAAVFLSAAGFGLAAHLIATNVLAASHRMLPRWLIVGGLISAVAFLSSAVLGSVATDTSSNTISLIGFGLWLAWILGVSYQLNALAPRPQKVGHASAAPALLDRGLPR